MKFGFKIFLTDAFHFFVGFCAGRRYFPFLSAVVVGLYFIYQVFDLAHKEKPIQTLKDLVVFAYGFLMGLI